MDRMIVVSNHSKNVFNNTEYKFVNENQEVMGVLKNEVPIYPVQYETRQVDAKPVDLKAIDTKFNFLSVAQAGPRKNLTLVVQSFIDEFHEEEDVGLILKTFSMNNSFSDRRRTKSDIRNWIKDTYPDKKCSVYMLHGNLTEEEMQGLYQNKNVHAYFTLTHGEGFGLPIFEAAINELPIIAPAWSGQVDYLYMPVENEKSGKVKITPLFQKVTYELREVPKEAVWEGVVQKDSKWCYPKFKSAKKALRSTYSGYNLHKKNAKILSSKIKEKFSQEKMYNMFCDAFEGNVDSQEERVHLL